MVANKFFSLFFIILQKKIQFQFISKGMMIAPFFFQLKFRKIIETSTSWKSSKHCLLSSLCSCHVSHLRVRGRGEGTVSILKCKSNRGRHPRAFQIAESKDLPDASGWNMQMTRNAVRYDLSLPTRREGG